MKEWLPAALSSYNVMLLHMLRRRRTVSGVLILLIVAAVALFSLQNGGSVRVSFPFWRFETSFAAVIFFVVLSGELAAQLLPQWVVRQFSRGRKPHDI